MANIQQYDTAQQKAVVQINNALTDIMNNSQSWKFFMSKLPAEKQQRIPNEVFSYVTLHADTVKDLDYNEFMARVVDCYSQGYTLTDGEAYILPFWNSKEKRNVATFVKGYIGVQRRAMETGLFRYFTVSPIYKGAIKGYNHRRGIPIFNDEFIPKGTEEIIGYFGYYEMYSGAIREIYCGVESLEAHALKYSPQSRKAEHLVGTWREAFDAMCQKTMYLKLGKLAPKTKNPTQQQQKFYESLEENDEPQDNRPSYIDVDGVVVDDNHESLPFDERLPFDELPEDYRAQDQDDGGELVCYDCGAKISDKVFDYSCDKFGKPLCFKCQKKITAQ